MRHPLCLTAALLSLLSTAAANDTVDAAATTDSEWPELDAELEALNQELLAPPTGPRFWGYVRTNFAHSDELRNAAGRSYSGVAFDNIRVNATGEFDRYAYRITGDLAQGTLALVDAFVRINVGEGIHGTFGLFRPPFLSSGLVEARDLLFITRTRNGVFNSIRDRGIGFDGEHGRFRWAIAGHNGADDIANKVLLTGRASIDVIGEAQPAWEGAYSTGDEARVNVAIAYQDDGAASDAGAFAVEATAIVGDVYLHGEIVDYGDDWSLDPNFPGEQRGGTTPWSVVASWLFPNEQWEAAFRYDDYDDTTMPANFDRTLYTLGLNYYVAGHDLKWQLNYGYQRNGGIDDLADANVLALGLTLGF